MHTISSDYSLYPHTPLFFIHDTVRQKRMKACSRELLKRYFIRHSLRFQKQFADFGRLEGDFDKEKVHFLKDTLGVLIDAKRVLKKKC